MTYSDIKPYVHLTDEQVQEARRLRAQNPKKYTLKRLAKRFYSSKTTMHRIMKLKEGDLLRKPGREYF